MRSFDYYFTRRGTFIHGDPDGFSKTLEPIWQRSSKLLCRPGGHVSLELHDTRARHRLECQAIFDRVAFYACFPCASLAASRFGRHSLAFCVFNAVSLYLALAALIQRGRGGEEGLEFVRDRRHPLEAWVHTIRKKNVAKADEPDGDEKTVCVGLSASRQTQSPAAKPCGLPISGGRPARFHACMLRRLAPVSSAAVAAAASRGREATE